MNRILKRNTNPFRRGVAALAILALLGLSSPALGAEEGHAGIVLEKDATAKTLTLANGKVVQVSARTVITGVDGQRIGFAEIPAAVAMSDGSREVSGDEGISYEAVTRRGTISATRIQVLEGIPE